MSDKPKQRRGPTGILFAAWRADPGRLLVGVPLLLLGGATICGDATTWLWVQADPEHRTGLYFLPVGIVLFLAGLRLVWAAIHPILRSDQLR
jgi:hypothetical protein